MQTITESAATAAAREELQEAHAALARLERRFAPAAEKATAVARKNAANAAWLAARRAHFAKHGVSVA